MAASAEMAKGNVSVETASCCASNAWWVMMAATLTVTATTPGIPHTDPIQIAGNAQRSPIPAAGAASRRIPIARTSTAGVQTATHTETRSRGVRTIRAALQKIIAAPMTNSVTSSTCPPHAVTAIARTVAEASSN